MGKLREFVRLRKLGEFGKSGKPERLPHRSGVRNGKLEIRVLNGKLGIQVLDGMLET